MPDLIVQQEQRHHSSQRWHQSSQVCVWNFSAALSETFVSSLSWEQRQPRVCLRVQANDHFHLDKMRVRYMFNRPFVCFRIVLDHKHINDDHSKMTNHIIKEEMGICASHQHTTSLYLLRIFFGINKHKTLYPISEKIQLTGLSPFTISPRHMAYSRAQLVEWVYKPWLLFAKCFPNAYLYSFTSHGLQTRVA